MADWISLIGLLFQIIRWFKDIQDEEMKKSEITLSERASFQASVWAAFDEVWEAGEKPALVLRKLAQTVDGFGEALVAVLENNKSEIVNSQSKAVA